MNIVSKTEITGYIVAPLTIPLFMCVLGIPELLETEQFSFSFFIKFMQQLLVLSLFALPIAYGLTLAIGLPMYYVLKKSRYVNATNIVASAAVIGTLPLLAVLVNGGNLGARIIIVFTLMGACAGYVFWLIIKGHITNACRRT